MENKGGHKGPYEGGPASHDMNGEEEDKVQDIEEYIASPFLIAEDGSCTSCKKIVDMDCESIQCFRCNNSFHAIHCSEEKTCVSTATSFKNHLLPAVNKASGFAKRFGRFLFQCDYCITAEEKAGETKFRETKFNIWFYYIQIIL